MSERPGLQQRPFRFPAGLPAATVIGQTAGGVVLEFVALAAPREVRVIPLSSPREPEAPRYADSISSREPGKAREGRSAARAERAKLVVSGSSGLLFVSGMAAVLGQKSLPRHDVESQTRATLDNIGVLIGKNNLRRAGVLGLAGVNGFTFLRAYVRRAADIPKVRRICEGAFGRIPALYIQADICREELLVELEGLIRSRSS
jgi:enamine deaminase RidA (YjgF/YER057c/UK114 family)